MGYYIDLSSIPLDTYQKRLETTDLLPSQQLLKIDIEEKFKEIKSHNIVNMFQLQQTLKTKEKVKQFSETTSLPIDYLTVLRREINSYHPRPRKIKDFPGLSGKLKEKLVQIGVQTTVELYDKTATKSERDKLKKEMVEVLTGVNLPMIIAIVQNRSVLKLSELAEKAQEAGKTSISLAGKLLESG